MTSPKHIPLRSCVTCGQRLPKREIIRIVRTVEGNVEVDATGRKPGRGAYFCRREECWQQGMRKGRIEHVLRAPLLDKDREALMDYYVSEFKPASVGEGS